MRKKLIVVVLGLAIMVGAYSLALTNETGGVCCEYRVSEGDSQNGNGPEDPEPEDDIIKWAQSIFFDNRI